MIKGIKNNIQPKSSDNIHEGLKNRAVKLSEKLRQKDAELEKEVSKRKQLEKALKESIQKNKKLFETSNDAIFIADTKTGLIIDANKKASKLLGIPIKKIIGMHQTELHPAEENERYKEIFREHVKKEKAFSTDTCVINRSGHSIPVEISASVAKFNGKKVIQGIFRNISWRKHKEDLLIESEEKYRGIVNNINIGVSIISPNMEILFLNDRMKEWFPKINITKKPVCYKSFNSPPGKKICTYCPAVKTFKDGKVHEAITETPAGNEIRNYRVISSPVKNNEGETVSVIEIVEDFTEQKQTEDKLRRSKDRFRSAASTTADLLWEGDVRKGTLQWFGDIDKLLGYEHGEFPRTIEGHMKEIHPEDHGQFVRSVKNSLKTGKDFSSEYRIRCKDGSYRYWHERGKAVDFENNKPVVWVGAISDITERKAAEEKILQSKNYWEDTFDTIPDMITIHDKDFNIIMANKAAKKMLKLPSLENNKIKCFKYYHGTDIPPEDCPSCKCLKTGKPGIYETFEPHLDMNIEVRAIPQFNGKNHLVGIIHVLRDITEHKEAEYNLLKSENELRIKAENLEDANTALKVLLKQREEDKTRFEERIQHNVKMLVLPYLEKIKMLNSETNIADHINILESNLNGIISTFSKKLSSKYIGLTPKEIQVANLIKDGGQSKDIAESLNLSLETVNCHRQNIRKKLGIMNTKTNLRSHLLSMLD